MPLLDRRVVLALSLALASLACGGRDATRYVGTASDAIVPDSAGQFALTLWAHTDTSMVGYLRVSAPARGSGSAVLEHVGSGLQLRTVSEQGDTVAWTSQQSDEAIGGKYSFVGGRTSGQGGTWRAKLVDGPPATVESLRQMNRALPPFDAIWPSMLIVALIVVAARWVRAAPVVVMPLREPGQTVGIRSWLALFVFGQTVTVLMMTAKLGTLLSPFEDGSWDLGGAIAGMRGLLIVESTVHLAQIILPAIGIYLTVTRKRFAPRFWFAYLAGLGLYAIVDIAGAAWLRAQMSLLFTPESASTIASEASQASTANLRTIAVALIWCLYWIKSVQVKATFGQTAFTDPRPAT
jgi:hypothetical protein